MRARYSQLVLFFAGVESTFGVHLRSPLQADWNIVKKGWFAHVLGEAEHKFKDVTAGLKELRVRNSSAAHGAGLLL
jgi:hypothetical protein